MYVDVNNCFHFLQHVNKCDDDRFNYFKMYNFTCKTLTGTLTETMCYQSHNLFVLQYLRHNIF